MIDIGVSLKENIDFLMTWAHSETLQCSIVGNWAKANINWVTPERQTRAEKRGETRWMREKWSQDNVLIKAQMFNKSLCL
jgi:hypothetical protein